ncbi:hypothetical protein SUGI_0751090 [Cryptomeria japonica]|nr:hypothetical protein SUGI_0751090 [Cryptomeria japonica]
MLSTHRSIQIVVFDLSQPHIITARTRDLHTINAIAHNIQWRFLRKFRTAGDFLFNHEMPKYTVKAASLLKACSQLSTPPTQQLQHSFLTKTRPRKGSYIRQWLNIIFPKHK